MTLFSLFLLAIIQGLTEFLPISSSAHLALLHEINGTGEEDVALDVAVHLGSILAVIVYFHADSAAAGRGLADIMRGRRQSTDAATGRAVNARCRTLHRLLHGPHACPGLVRASKNESSIVE